MDALDNPVSSLRDAWLYDKEIADTGSKWYTNKVKAIEHAKKGCRKKQITTPMSEVYSEIYCGMELLLLPLDTSRIVTGYSSL